MSYDSGVLVLCSWCFISHRKCPGALAGTGHLTRSKADLRRIYLTCTKSLKGNDQPKKTGLNKEVIIRSQQCNKQLVKMSETQGNANWALKGLGRQLLKDSIENKWTLKLKNSGLSYETLPRVNSSSIKSLEVLQTSQVCKSVCHKQTRNPFFLFWDKIIVRSPGLAGTHYVNQMLGLKAVPRNSMVTDSSLHWALGSVIWTLEM